jgi:hypothetical protein
MVLEEDALRTAPHPFWAGRFFVGRRSASAISVRDGDVGDIHALLTLFAKVVLTTSPEN